jgi:hypothetical protein
MLPTAESDPKGRHKECRGDEVPRGTMLPTAELDPKGRHKECRGDEVPRSLCSQRLNQTRRVDTRNAGATKSPGSLCFQRLNQARRVDTIRCRSDAPCRESFARYLTYAKIHRTTRPGRVEVTNCLVLLYGYETLSCSSPISTQVGGCALCSLVSSWEIFFKNFEKFSCN